jgi:hypothetical protein
MIWSQLGAGIRLIQILSGKLCLKVDMHKSEVSTKIQRILSTFITKCLFITYTRTFVVLLLYSGFDDGGVQHLMWLWQPMPLFSGNPDNQQQSHSSMQ